MSRSIIKATSYPFRNERWSSYHPVNCYLYYKNLSHEEMTKTKASEQKHQSTEIEVADIVELQPTPNESVKILRKIDLVLMPIMCACYMLQLLDKLTLNYSSQLGLIKDLNLHGSQFSWSSSVFYFGYLFWTRPSSWLVVRLPLGKYIAGTVLTWGAVLMCHSACHNFEQLVLQKLLWLRGLPS